MTKSKYWVPVASTKNVTKWKKFMRAVDSIQIGLRAATGFYERVAEESEDFYNRYSKPF